MAAQGPSPDSMQHGEGHHLECGIVIKNKLKNENPKILNIILL